MKLKILSVFLVLLGLMQSFGHVMGNKTIKSLGLITVASPLPIVFTQQKGFLETFALDFRLVYEENGLEKNIPITPALYAKLDKPYNYRNVLGAAISYGPILPETLVQSVLGYAFIEPAKVRKAFGIDEMKNVYIKLTSKTKNVDKTYILRLGEKE